MSKKLELANGSTITFEVSGSDNLVEFAGCAFDYTWVEGLDDEPCLAESVRAEIKKGKVYGHFC